MEIYATIAIAEVTSVKNRRSPSTAAANVSVPLMQTSQKSTNWRRCSYLSASVSSQAQKSPVQDRALNFW
jgi:hypothetical protein